MQQTLPSKRSAEAEQSGEVKGVPSNDGNTSGGFSDRCNVIGGLVVFLDTNCSGAMVKVKFFEPFFGRTVF